MKLLGKHKKVYLCGKVSGRSYDATRTEFFYAESEIRAKGYEVINPLRIVNDPKTSWPEAMKLCIPAMLKSDIICLLDSWKDSRGAHMEVDIGIAVELEIFKIDEF